MIKVKPVYFWAESVLFDELTRMNENGDSPELPCFDALATAFLATLTDPDADRVHVVATEGDGKAHVCLGSCDEYSPCGWHPTYPVTALVPDEATA